MIDSRVGLDTGARRQGEGPRPVSGSDASQTIGRIGRYAVLGQIADGGMGSVLVAQMRGPAAFSRLVAIKCLRTRWLGDPAHVARFTTEVKLSTLIRHPNVVQTLDVVEKDGELFLVMEYVDGVTLGGLLTDLSRARCMLPVGIAIGILSAVLRGLHAAHEAVDHDGACCHIVHSDVSPQNIMLGRNGHVQVLDFGAAKAVEESQHTAGGVLIGKLAYMAPEQLCGEPSSPRTDVFSAGAVLWEALVGRRLFYEPGLDRKALLHAVVRKPVPRPSQLRSDVPKALDDVVKRALSRDPERRFQTALEFGNALESLGVAQWEPALAALVGQRCAGRLAKKDALLRTGLAAAAEARELTPMPRALELVSPPSFSGVALPTAPPPPPAQNWRFAWLGAALLVGSAVWWTFDSALVQRSRSAGALASGHAEAPVAAGSDVESVQEVARSQEVVGSSRTAGNEIAAAPLTFSLLPVAAPELSPPESSMEGARAREELRRDTPLTLLAREARARTKWQRSRSLPSSFEAPSRAAARACDPPTYMDAAGIRHFKKDCL